MSIDYTKCAYACKTKSWGWICSYEDIPIPDMCNGACITTEETSLSRTLKERVLECDYDNFLNKGTYKVVDFPYPEESE